MKRYEPIFEETKKLQKFIEMSVFQPKETNLRYPLQIAPLIGKAQHQARAKIIGKGWELSIDIHPPFTIRGKVPIKDFGEDDKKAVKLFVEKNQKVLLDLWNNLIDSDKKAHSLITSLDKKR